MGIDARMLLRVKREPTDADLKRWSWQIAEALGAGAFFINAKDGYGAISRTGTRWRDECDPKPGTLYTQDGDDIVAEPGETLLEVHLATRYYGVGYERGDLLTICAAAEWCEVNIPNCAVWYGGDSSGVCAEPFPDEERRKLRNHLFTKSGRAYFQRGAWGPTSCRPDLSDCKLCIPEGSISQYGTGKDYAAWSCAGCGKHFVTEDGGKTWNREKGEAAA